jgi:MtaA/CmuA family methyltransferase
MNSYTRLMEMVHGRPVDHVPRIPILMQFAADYIGSNYGAFASDYRVLVEANARCAADFGLDQLSAISDPYRETHGFGAEIVFQRDSVPKCARPPLSERKDLTLLASPDPYQSARMLDRIAAIRAYHARYASSYSIMGWIEGPAAEAADLRGVATFLVDLLDDRPFCADLMDRCVEVGIAFAKAQIDAGADTIGIGDAVASQVSPKIYDTLIQPREKRLVQAIRQMGGLARLHICGNITHLLPGIADLGMHILDVDHMVDLRHVRAIVGESVALAGNIDPVGGILRGSPASIRAALHAIYAAVGNPYCVNAGCEIPAGTPYDNLRALCAPLAYAA